MNHNYGLCDSCYRKEFEDPSTMAVFVPCLSRWCNQEHSLEQNTDLSIDCYLCKNKLGLGELVYGCDSDDRYNVIGGSIKMCQECYCLIR